MKTKNALRTALIVVAILFIVSAAIGTLTVPVVLSFNYSWYWLFLYVGYLALAIYVTVLCRILD